MVVVALGEPGVPVVPIFACVVPLLTCASAKGTAVASVRINTERCIRFIVVFLLARQEAEFLLTRSPTGCLFSIAQASATGSCPHLRGRAPSFPTG